MNRRNSLLRLLLVLLALCLSGCSTAATRPDAYTVTRETTANEIPVGAETDPTPPKKRVALTFDDGPNHYDDRTKNVVDELAKYDFRATFFVVGNRISGGDALSYAVRKGNEIGIHGYTHNVYYDSCDSAEFEDELNSTAEAIHSQLPGYEINLMRPIGGRISPQHVAVCPYSVILWSVDSDDWNNKYYAGISDEEAEARVNTIVENVMSQVSDGDIILMHDIYESTYDAVKLLLPLLDAAGYEAVTVSELLGDSLMPGVTYSYAVSGK